jgi:signal transduction histidine kinase
MLLANDLEEVNEKLEEQKKQIEEQANKLKLSHKEILDVNEELQSQNDYILDQSDYLHEANERISQMHDDLQRQKEEILDKNNELINLNKEKNNLIGVVAHDLKSPINQIKGLLTIIKFKQDQLDSETLSYLDIIEKSTTRLTDMINKILDVEAIESKKLNIKLEEVDLKEILTEVASNFKLSADKKEIILNLDLKGKQSVIQLDRNFTIQIFENLLSNAIKFSPHDKSIFITLKNSKGNVICEIKDEGPGLSEQDKKLLFSKYQKLSAQPTGDELSTGLGLSIVKKFTEGMGGKIWHESVVGQGTSFFVSFPIK